MTGGKGQESFSGCGGELHLKGKLHWTWLLPEGIIVVMKNVPPVSSSFAVGRWIVGYHCFSNKSQWRKRRELWSYIYTRFLFARLSKATIVTWNTNALQCKGNGSDVTKENQILIKTKIKYSYDFLFWEFVKWKHDCIKQEALLHSWRCNFTPGPCVELHMEFSCNGLYLK